MHRFCTTRELAIYRNSADDAESLRKSTAVAICSRWATSPGDNNKFTAGGKVQRKVWSLQQLTNSSFYPASVNFNDFRLPSTSRKTTAQCWLHDFDMFWRESVQGRRVLRARSSNALNCLNIIKRTEGQTPSFQNSFRGKVNKLWGIMFSSTGKHSQAFQTNKGMSFPILNVETMFSQYSSYKSMLKHAKIHPQPYTTDFIMHRIFVWPLFIFF